MSYNFIFIYLFGDVTVTRGILQDHLIIIFSFSSGIFFTFLYKI